MALSIVLIWSVGSCSGLLDFRQIAKIVVINIDIIFDCRLMTWWYIEHLRAYELCSSHLSTFSATQLSELNYVFFHLTELETSSLLHLNVTYYAEWIKQLSKWLLLRVIITEDDIRKLTLNERPQSIEELKVQLVDKLSLQYDFKLLYEDQDFKAFCNLTEITDLPERATLKIIPLSTLHLTALSSPTTTSDTECSTADTEILSTGIASLSLRQQWPEIFDIPNFSVDVEYRLRQADLAFMKDGTRMTLPRDVKHDILEKLA